MHIQCVSQDSIRQIETQQNEIPVPRKPIDFMHPEANWVIDPHAPSFMGTIDCSDERFKKYNQPLIDINGLDSIHKHFFFWRFHFLSHDTRKIDASNRYIHLQEQPQGLYLPRRHPHHQPNSALYPTKALVFFLSFLFI